MSSLALAIITLGVVITALLVAVLMGEAIYHWGGLVLRRRFGRSSKRGTFELGEQEVSDGVAALIEDIGSVPVLKCLRRHQSGDWGEIEDEHQQLNRLSLEKGGRWGFESAYTMEGKTVLRIFTFEDCSGTLLLTDEEYSQALLSMDKECPQENEALYVRSLRDYRVGKSPLKDG